MAQWVAVAVAEPTVLVAWAVRVLLGCVVLVPDTVVAVRVAVEVPAATVLMAVFVGWVVLVEVFATVAVLLGAAVEVRVVVGVLAACVGVIVEVPQGGREKLSF